MNPAAPSHACRQVRLRQFRNFAELELAFPPEGAAIIGENGSGKTNLVEALYYCEIFRSFRGAPDEDLVRFGEDTFHIRCRIESAGTEREITAGFQRTSRRKRVTVDGVEPERIGDALGQVGAVVFSPSDARIVGGPPNERRRFLDIVLSLHQPGYLAALQQYRRTLRQRNALLRDGAAADELEPWNAGLEAWGTRVIAWRAAWVRTYQAEFSRRTAWIAGGVAIDLQYVSSVPGAAEGSDEAIRAAFAAELARLAGRERERGVTLVGPHRDDLRFTTTAGGRNVDLRGFGSGGQQRTAAIALRMIEASTVRESTGHDPIILLDDVFAELDAGRAARILESIEAEQHGQVILTAPKESDLEVRRGYLPRWRIHAGKVFT